MLGRYVILLHFKLLDYANKSMPLCYRVVLKYIPFQDNAKMLVFYVGNNGHYLNFKVYANEDVRV